MTYKFQADKLTKTKQNYVLYNRMFLHRSIQTDCLCPFWCKKAIISFYRINDTLHVYCVYSKGLHTSRNELFLLSVAMSSLIGNTLHKNCQRRKTSFTKFWYCFKAQNTNNLKEPRIHYVTNKCTFTYLFLHTSVAERLQVIFKVGM